jgi:hypothetical protein
MFDRYTFVILTYQDNIPFAEETQRILLDKWKCKSTIEIGYKVGDIDPLTNKPLKHNEVVMAGFRDKIAKKYNQDIYYLEDDVRFTKHPLADMYIPRADIVWSVWRRGSLDNKPPHNIITGIQAVWFSREALFRMNYDMKDRRLIHFDSYVSKFITQQKGDNTFVFKQVVPKMGYEQKHKSLISKQKDWKKYMEPN